MNDLGAMRINPVTKVTIMLEIKRIWVKLYSWAGQTMNDIKLSYSLFCTNFVPQLLD
jgi:hypothetical protein